MATIEIDFEVYKALTTRRHTETTSYNDVIRELLGMPRSGAHSSQLTGNSSGWVSKGITFPNGTEFRTTYKGKEYLARVENNRLILNGKVMSSPSLAAHEITKTNVNGWRFWECRFPGDSRWRIIESLRTA